MTEALNEFVKDARKAGKSFSEIRTVLVQSGWEQEQIEDSLGRFVETDFPVAVPKAVVFASPRLFFLNLFHFLVLYVSVYNVASTLFTFLDYYLPDGLGRTAGLFYSRYYTIGDAIRDNLAAIIICVPLVYLSHRAVTAAMAETKQRIPRIRLKLIYLTMFIGACVMVGNGICFVYYFLSGELGLRFMIKVAILTALTLGLFACYRVEIKQTESKA